MFERAPIGHSHGDFVDCRWPQRSRRHPAVRQELKIFLLGETQATTEAVLPYWRELFGTLLSRRRIGVGRSLAQRER